MSEQTVNECLEKISESALQAYNSRGTDGFDRCFRAFYETLKVEYGRYLYAIYGCSEATADEDTVEKINISYLAVVGNLDVIRSLIDNYSPEKGSFGNYFAASTKYTRAGEVAKQTRENTRGGITGLFTDREQRILHRIIDFYTDSGANELSDEDLQTIAKAQGIGYEKVRDIWLRNRNSNVMSINIAYSDDGNDEGDLLDEESYRLYISGESEAEDSEDTFVLILCILDELYHSSFSENHKKMFPPVFTSKYIKECVDEVKERFRLGSVKEAIKSNWADIRLEQRRDKYSGYLCVSRPVFDFVIEVRTLIKQKDIAAGLKVSETYITKIYNEVFTLLRAKMNKVHD